MRSLTLKLSVAILFLSILGAASHVSPSPALEPVREAVQQEASAACSGDITSFYLASDGYYKAAGWATCTAKLCVKVGSYSTCDISAPLSAKRSAGVCLTNSPTTYVYAYLSTYPGGTMLDAASLVKCRG